MSKPSLQTTINLPRSRAASKIWVFSRCMIGVWSSNPTASLTAGYISVHKSIYENSTLFYIVGKMQHWDNEYAKP